MPSIWSAVDGGSCWTAREGGSVPAVADAIEMSPGDLRELTFDFGNLREFYDGGSIDLTILPVVTVSGGNSTFTEIQALPVSVTYAQPIGISLVFTYENDEVYGNDWIGAYYVQFWCNAGTVTGNFTVSVMVVLTDGTELTRQGALNVGNCGGCS